MMKSANAARLTISTALSLRLIQPRCSSVTSAEIVVPRDRAAMIPRSDCETSTRSGDVGIEASKVSRVLPTRATGSSRLRASTRSIADARLRAAFGRRLGHAQHVGARQAHDFGPGPGNKSNPPLLARQGRHIPHPESRTRDQAKGLPVPATLHMHFDAAFKNAEDPSGVIPHTVDGIASFKRHEGAKGKGLFLK